VSTDTQKNASGEYENSVVITDVRSGAVLYRGGDMAMFDPGTFSTKNIVWSADEGIVGVAVYRKGGFQLELRLIDLARGSELLRKELPFRTYLIGISDRNVLIESAAMAGGQALLFTDPYQNRTNSVPVADSFWDIKLSKDHRRLGFSTGTAFQVLDSNDGGVVATVDRAVFAFLWSPKGERILTVDETNSKLVVVEMP
jgi:hypothetical protein